MTMITPNAPSKRSGIPKSSDKPKKPKALRKSITLTGRKANPKIYPIMERIMKREYKNLPCESLRHTVDLITYLQRTQDIS